MNDRWIHFRIMPFYSKYISVKLRKVPWDNQKHQALIKQMADDNPKTCYEITSMEISKNPLTLVLNSTLMTSENEFIVRLVGSNLYCLDFDETCSKLAMQVMARSFTDIPLKEKCTPFCGGEAKCNWVGSAANGSWCDLKCTCPRGGCKEVIFVISHGALLGSQAMQICEIQIV